MNRTYNSSREMKVLVIMRNFQEIIKDQPSLVIRIKCLNEVSSNEQVWLISRRSSNLTSNTKDITKLRHLETRYNHRYQNIEVWAFL
mgnify:CR=1 FL=1